jgi:hypothetical protein
MPHTKNSRGTCLCAAAALFVSAAAVMAQAQSTQPGTLILGEIERLTVDDLRDRSSGGSIVVSGKQITIPGSLLIGLPKGRLTIRDLVLDGPDQCKSLDPPESGLALSDACRNDGSPGLVRVVANRTPSGDLVASLVMVQKDSARTLARITPESPRAVRRPAGDSPQQFQDGGADAKAPVKPPQ